MMSKALFGTPIHQVQIVTAGKGQGEANGEIRYENLEARKEIGRDR